MRDLRNALAAARESVAKVIGNTGNSGNTPKSASQNNNLDEHERVSTAEPRVATLATGSADVATVATAFQPVDTLGKPSKGKSKQSVTEPVATVSTVATEKQQARENSKDGAVVSLWRAGLGSFAGSFPPCPGFSPDKWLRVRQAAARFLDEFGEKAAAFGWGDLDLFGVHVEAGIIRGDCSGALMLSNGRRIVAVSEQTIAYEDKLTFYRKPDRERGPSVVIWAFKGGQHG